MPDAIAATVARAITAHADALSRGALITIDEARALAIDLLPAALAPPGFVAVASALASASPVTIWIQDREVVLAEHLALLRDPDRQREIVVVSRLIRPQRPAQDHADAGCPRAQRRRRARPAAGVRDLMARHPRVRALVRPPATSRQHLDGCIR